MLFYFLFPFSYHAVYTFYIGRNQERILLFLLLYLLVCMYHELLVFRSQRLMFLFVIRLLERSIGVLDRDVWMRILRGNYLLAFFYSDFGYQEV